MTDKRIVKLLGPTQRQHAANLVISAPDGYVCTIQEPTRSLDQNARLWAMLGDVSKAKPLGRSYTPEMWKCVFMQACGHEVQFLQGIDGMPFPSGFKSSKMTVRQMAELITYIDAFMAENGIRSSELNPYE